MTVRHDTHGAKDALFLYRLDGLDLGCFGEVGEAPRKDDAFWDAVVQVQAMARMKSGRWWLTEPAAQAAHERWRAAL